MRGLLIPAQGTVRMIAWSRESDDMEPTFDFTGQLEWRRPVVGLLFDPYSTGSLVPGQDGDFLQARELIVCEAGCVYTANDYLHSVMGDDHWGHATSIYEPHVSGPVTDAPRFRSLRRTAVGAAQSLGGKPA